MTEVTYTPGPWEWRDVAGAGLEIHANLSRVPGLELPRGIPDAPIKIYDLAAPQNFIVACERWVQFEPKGWHEVQVANARLIAAAPDLLNALQSVRKLISEAAMTGFNCNDGDWAERLFHSQQQTSRAIDAATGSGPKPIAKPAAA